MSEGKGFASAGCFVCGRENPVGLRLSWELDATAGTAEGRWFATDLYQGFDGIIHGGIVMALLDDAMWWAIYAQGGFTVTVEASVRFASPLRPGEPARVTARVVERQGRLWVVAAEVRGPDDRLVATAQGRFLQVPRQAEGFSIAVERGHPAAGGQ